MRGRFGLLAILGIIVFALVVGGIGYGIGLNAGATGVVAPPGGVVYPVGYYHGWGFGGFGLFGVLFFFLFIGLIFAALRPRRWSGGPGWGGPGMGGPGWRGGWSARDLPPGVQSTLEEWHRQAHESGPSDGPKQTSTV